MLLVRAIVVTALVTGLIIGGLWALDEYGDRRVASAKVDWDAQREREKQADREAVANAAGDAERARQGALVPGSLARLIKDWCRDCEGTP